MGKKMIVIAEIAFAIVFIILMATIFKTVTSVGNNANSQLENIQRSIEEAELQSYDKTIVSGDTIISTINKMRETDTGLRLSYNIDGKPYGYGMLNSSGSDAYNSSGEVVSGVKVASAESSYKRYDTSLRPGDTDFISPVAEYNSNVICNSNGTVIGVYFTAT